MPAFDGTGPMGSGPMTGWGRGCCAGNGRGMGRRAPAFLRPRMTAADEKTMLAEEVQAVSGYLKDLQARQKELGGK